VKAPKHDLKFDGDYFIRLLASSISLSKDEKKKIIESIPKLKQAQIDELIRIFEEEKQKFAALSKKHVPQLEKLAQQHHDEWMDLETEFTHTTKKKEDEGKADEIRKNLGL
jgi:DNA anti-recombination protein RmuC